MNRYAHIYCGKIIYIVKTDLTLEEVKKGYTGGEGFSPVWVDITNLNAEIGWQISFNDDGEISFVAPKYDELSVEDKRERKLKMIEKWTEQNITSHVVVQYKNAFVAFDTDTETQLTLQSLTAFSAEDFNIRFPDGYPVRGEASDEKGKKIFYMGYEQIRNLLQAISKHTILCKQVGWDLQKKTQEATTDKELDAIEWPVSLPDVKEYAMEI